MTPKVSVAMITYGHEPYIARALDSILSQEVDFEYEIVIGEDCSPDNTRSILEAYRVTHPGVIKPIFREKNIGMTANVYDVLMHCEGEYVAYLEGDDYWIDPLKLKKQVDFLATNSDYSSVSHVLEMRDVSGVFLGYTPIDKKIIGNEIAASTFCTGRTFSFCSSVFRNPRKDLERSAFRDLVIKNPTGDFTLCLFLLDKGKVFVMKDVMSVYQVVKRKGALNYNSSHSMMDKCKNDYQVFNSNDRYYCGKYSFRELYFSLLCRALVAGIFEKRQREYWKMFTGFSGKIRIMHLFRLPYDLCRLLLIHFKLVHT